MREAVDPEREAAALREPRAHQAEEFLGEEVRRARRATGWLGCDAITS